MKLPFLKKRDFRPDRQTAVRLSRLWPTPKQQLRILRWVLLAAVCLIGLLAQDVWLYRIDLFGGCTDLVPCLVLTVAVMQGAEQGSLFALAASVLYFFSGSSAGFWVIPILTGVAVATAIFRQAFLRRGFWAVVLCAAAGMFVYEAGLFAVNLFLGLTAFSRVGAMLSTVVLSVLAAAVCYPLLLAVGKLGGDAWGE